MEFIKKNTKNIMCVLGVIILLIGLALCFQTANIPKLNTQNNQVFAQTVQTDNNTFSVNWKTVLNNANLGFKVDEIAELSFVQSSQIPTGYSGQLNISYSGNGEIYLSHIKRQNDSLYNVVIWSPSTIYFPEDSSNLFDSNKYINGNILLEKIIKITFANINTSNVTDMSGMFDDCSSLESITFPKGFNTACVTDMSTMFSDCKALTSLDLLSFNTACVTDMSHMFNGCEKLEGLNLSSFNTSNVTTWVSIFSNCKSLKTLDLSSFSTEKVNTMYYMFMNCYSLESINFPDAFTASEVTSMNRTFYGCSALKSITFSENFNIEKVTDMSYMFYCCYDLESIAMSSSFKTTNITKMNSMFYNCKSLTELDLSNFNTEKVTDMSYVFKGCEKLQVLDISSFNTLNSVEIFSMFSGCTNLDFSTIDLSKLNTYNVTDMDYVFSGCDVENLDLSKLNTQSVTDMTGIFSGCKNVASLDLSKLNTANVINMSNMFSGCDVENLDLSKLNTQSATDMSNMFSSCEALTSLNLSNFDTSKVTDMSDMFEFCENLRELDLSSFNTSVVNNMEGMFGWCYKLEKLNLSSFNTANVTDMNHMFACCKALTSLNLSNFDTSKVTDMGSMFSSCNKLSSLDLSNFNLASITTSFSFTTPQYTYYLIAPYNLQNGVEIKFDDYKAMCEKGTLNVVEELTSANTSTSATDKREFVSYYYNIILKDKGGADFSGDYMTEFVYVYGADTNIWNAYKEGDEFLGWYLTPDCSGSPITQIGATDYTPTDYTPGHKGDITIYASWKSSPAVPTNYYTVTFYSEDGSQELGTSTVTYGETATYQNGTPTKTSTAQYTYEFDGWVTSIGGTTKDDLTNVTSDRNVYVKFKEILNKYKVKFYSEDGIYLTEVEVAYGTDATYPNSKPTKPLTVQYTYEFDGWVTSIGGTTKDDLTNVTSDRNVYVKFKSTTRKYTIKFVNHDGTELQNDLVEYGVLPVYKGDEPTKEATAQYTYTFSGWNSIISNVTGDIIYQAQFSSIINEYEIVFLNFDGTVLKTEILEYGVIPQYSEATPIKVQDKNYKYIFNGWNPSISMVTKDEVYIAQYTAQPLFCYVTITYMLNDVIDEKTYKVSYGEDFSLKLSNEKYIIKSVKMNGVESYINTIKLEDVIQDVQVIVYLAEKGNMLLIVGVVAGIGILIIGVVITLKIKKSKNNKYDCKNTLEEINKLNMENANNESKEMIIKKSQSQQTYTSTPTTINIEEVLKRAQENTLKANKEQTANKSNDTKTEQQSGQIDVNKPPTKPTMKK